jgi:hypothetical protein
MKSNKTKKALNPQPLPPINNESTNKKELNPQPLPLKERVKKRNGVKRK